MIKFICDFCGTSADNADNIQTSNLLHRAISRAGNDRKNAGSLLPYGEHPDYCNRCFEILKDWLEGDLREWLRDNFPLKKESK